MEQSPSGAKIVHLVKYASFHGAQTIIAILIKKANKMHNFSDLFDKVLNMSS